MSCACPVAVPDGTGCRCVVESLAGFCENFGALDPDPHDALYLNKNLYTVHNQYSNRG